MTNDTGVHELHANKEKLYSELQELSKHISGAIAELKERREKRNALTRTAQEQKVLRKELSAVIKEKISQVKEMRAKRGERPKVVHMDERMSPGKLREEISRIERKIETSAMDFSEEQKLTKILKEKKVMLTKIGGDNDLDRNIRALSKEIDKLKKESDVAHDAVTIAAKESQEHHERILELSKKIEEWKTREVEVKNQYQTTKDQLTQHSPVDVPVKKMPRKKMSNGPIAPTADEKAVLAEKAAVVEQKVKEKKKLTTEDLLAFQAHK